MENNTSKISVLVLPEDGLLKETSVRAPSSQSTRRRPGRLRTFQRSTLHAPPIWSPSRVSQTRSACSGLREVEEAEVEIQVRF